MKEKYIEDLQDIRQTMSRASRFISLSGLSGISTGIIAIIGALVAYVFIFKEHDYLVDYSVNLPPEHLTNLLLIASGTLILSIGCAIVFTKTKTKRQYKHVWNQQAQRLLIHLAIPLVTGGLLCLMFLIKGYVGFLCPLTLIFYGLALLNGSKYTIPELRNLGLIEIFLGLLAFQFIAYGLLFWALGFGFIQIVYGMIVQKKY